MEINELKALWSEGYLDAEMIPSTDIKVMIKEKSKNTVVKMRNVLKNKIMFMGGVCLVVVGSLLLNYFDEEERYLFNLLSARQYNSIMLLMLGVVMACGFYVISLYRQVLAFESTSASIKITLEKTINMLKRMVVVNVYADAIGVPFFVSFILYIQLFGAQNLMPDMRVFVILLIAFFIFRLVRVSMNNYHSSKYGGYLHSLEACLDELQEKRANAS